MMPPGQQTALLSTTVQMEWVVWPRRRSAWARKKPTSSFTLAGRLVQTEFKFKLKVLESFKVLQIHLDESKWV
jgi:hypothetical protein